LTLDIWVDCGSLVNVAKPANLLSESRNSLIERDRRLSEYGRCRQDSGRAVKDFTPIRSSIPSSPAQSKRLAQIKRSLIGILPTGMGAELSLTTLL